MGFGTPDLRPYHSHGASSSSIPSRPIQAPVLTVQTGQASRGVLPLQPPLLTLVGRLCECIIWQLRLTAPC